MKSSGYVLSRVAEFFGDRFDSDVFIVAESAPDALQ
jgi:hypothetical protein